MRQFETLILLSPELPADARDGIINSFIAIIEREGGKIVEIDNWGARDLAYPVRKLTRGYYVRLVYDAPAPLVAELERNIRIADGVFKFITVKLDEDVEEEA